MKHQFAVRILSFLSILSMLLSAVGMPNGIAKADSPAGFQEGYESGWSDHTFIDTGTGWYSANGVYVENDFGVGGTWGVSNSANIFTWMGHPFQWSDSAVTGVLFGMDFQANASGQFDDDRVGWMIVGNNITSDNFFGVQMDPGGTGQNIEAYWDGVTVNDGGRTSIVSLTGITANAWYRLRAEITKLTATSARIDVTLTALDSGGNPGAVVASGTLLDTSLLPDTTENYKPKPGYFTATTMWPAYKNHNGMVGNADNVYFEILTSAPTPTITVTGTLNPFSSQPGVDSVEQSYSVAASGLTEDLVITAPADFQISTTSGSGFGSTLNLTPSSGTVASTPIYARFNRATEGTSSGDISHTSAGAVTQTLTVSGTASLPPVETLPINTGSTWKYLDNGTNQGTAWKEIAFNDASWASGAAELGYGDGGEATTVDCSAVANCNTNNYITTYFRKSFTVADRSLYSGLNLRLLRDDGAVVYLNGVEIWRTNMPTGTVTYTTLATTAIGGTDETTFVTPASTLANTLVDGTNVLAVEIHQQALTSTDISFDLELTGVSAPTCYALTLGHTGNGSTPTATPANSTGCLAGQYAAGEAITLSGATPDAGWQIDSWYGTSSSTSNALTMPASAHSTGVNYIETPTTGLICENFDAFTPGSTLGTYTGWYDGGSGPVVTSGNGVVNSIGLAAAANIYNWTAHPFNWNDPEFLSVTLQQDFRTDGAGQFDDDRLAWTTNGTSISSDYQFGVQLDHVNGGIVTYWRNSAGTRIQTPIVTLPTLTFNTWYRFNAKFTKLTATSAKIDVSLVQLDTSGNPTGMPYSGTVNDTSTWSGGAPATSYFTPTNMWPSYKTYNSAAAAPADNACYEVVSGEPPVQHTLATSTVGSGTIALSPSGGTYSEGTLVQLTASPAVGWTFTGWSGDLTGTTNPASLTMDADKTVIATFTQLPPVTLTVNKVGSGTVTLNPAGGSYAVGTVVQLSASPDANWTFSGWSGDLTGSANPASITMDVNKTINATFVEGPPPPAGTCESFESGFTLGQVVGSHAEWFDSGAGPVVTSGNGLAGSIGLAPGSSIFTWTQHPFNWNDPAFESITFSMDYQTDASGEFDDDRLGWMTTSTGTDSTTFFGVQLDTTEDGGIVTFWRNAAGTRVQTPIVAAASYLPNTWYRFDAKFTKLTPTSARIDVTLTQLDANGNLTGTPVTGTLSDTSTWPDGTPPDTYFTPTSVWPAYKNHSAITGAADNVCFNIVSGRFAFVVTTDWHTSDTYPNGGVTTKVGQIADWVNNPTSAMPAPEFMVITGDFPHLAQTDTVINSVLGNDFLWYPVIGNHEMDDLTNDFNVIRDTTVPALPNIVNHGPTGSLNTSYSFDYENAHFVVINPFWDGASNDHTAEGDISSALNSWVNTDLTTNGGTHNFAFMHTPAYPANRHVGEDLDAPANQARRDAFVATLNANNVETLFSGHTHYYEHDVAPEYPLGNLDQVTNGALRSGETTTITYVLVEGNTTTYKVYRWNGSAFALHEQWTIGGTPSTQPPAAPTTLAASATVYNQINLTWADNADNETGFEIERSTTGSGGTFTALTSVLADVEAYSNGGLTAEREYCYRVRAVNGVGQSAYSNVACATTPVQPPVTLTCETFNAYTPGSLLGTYAGWYDGGSGPVVTSGNGVLNSIGLAAATNIYHWTAHPFNWNASTFDSITLQQDFRTDSAGQFDDDRIAWTTVSNSTDSLNQFGVQLDHTEGGISTYWRNSSDVRVQTTIVTLPTLPANTWYRFHAKITKLTATTARIDVNLTQLDASGNPTGTSYAGSVENTGTWSGGAPAARYFSAATMWPSFKNYNSAAAAPADNACYEVVTGEPSAQYTLTVNTVGSGSVALNPAGGTYDEGTIVQLTANPVSGWSFNGWSGALTGTANPASITMDANKSVTATFIQQTGDLVGHWKFDASSGTSAMDSSTYGNNGTVSGATWTTGRVNNALSFDGTNDYVQVPNSTSLSLGTNRVTIAGWVYPTNTSSRWATIVQRSNSGGFWFDWQFYARAEDAPTANHPVFRMDWDSDGMIDSNEQVEGNIVLQANTWYYLTVTYDGTAMRFFIDGTLRGTTNISGGVIPASNTPIRIGGNDIWGEYFPGRIDDFRIYNRALSQSEIQLLMNPPTCYALTVTNSGTGTTPSAVPANSSGCPAGQYTAGTSISLSSAVPSAGWHISGWTGTLNNASTAATNTVTMPASAHTAGVVYVQNEYTLTVNTGGAGSGTVTIDPDQAVYHYNDIVGLTANANAGSAFTGWSGGLTGMANPATVTITANTTITANFDLVNSAPQASDDIYSTAENVTLTVPAPGVLGNDTDADSDPLTAVKVTDPTNGVLTLNGDGSFTYIPAPLFHGTDTFTYKANDGTVDGNTAIVTINVSSVNDAPVCTPVSLGTAEDVNGQASPSCTDADGDPLTYEIVQPAAHGTASIVLGQFFYIPNADFNGSDSFTYKANDGSVDSNAVTVNVTVSAVNDAPVLDAIADQTVNEGDLLAFTATASDVDAGDTPTFSTNGEPVGAAISTNGSFTWTPTEAQGPNSFTFQVCVSDGTDSDCQSVHVTVNEVNAAPVLDPLGGRTVNEGIELSFTATASDIDLPANTVTFALIGAPTGAGISTSGMFTWTPTEGQGAGVYPFDVCVSDGTLADCETITITVNEVNTAPVLNAVGNKTVEEGAELTFTATATDGDLPANTLIFSLTNAPAGAGITTGGVFSWIPSEMQGAGIYPFDICVSDGMVSDCETINVTVGEVNAAPVLAAIGNKSVNELTELTFTATATDTDLPANALSFSLVGAPAGTVTSGGIFTWTPAEWQAPGSYVFDVCVSDGTASDCETITVTVNEVNVAPVAASQSVTTQEDQALNITLSATDADLPSNALAYVVTPPAHGTLSGTAPELTYTPAANYNGLDSFSFTVNDGTADSTIATVSITVNAVNDIPIATAQSTSTELNTSKSIILTGTDVEGSPLTFAIVSNPAHGTLSGTAPNVSYIPSIGYVGADNFTFKVNDGTADSAPATVSIAVTDIGIPILPSSFYGEIHITDNPPAVGDRVEAYMPGITGTVALGTISLYQQSTLVYSIDIPAGSKGAAAEGDTITFKINGRTVSTGTWHTGSNVQLNFHPPQPLPGGAYSGNEGTPVNFSGTAADWGTDAALWQWDWENDGTIDAVGANPSHTWNDAGMYTVGLRVVDAQNGEGNTTFTVTVNDVLPTNVDAGGPYSPYIGEAITLNGSALCAPVDTCTFAWDLDGDADYDDATGTAPVHAWTQAGSYTISLRVTDEDGNAAYDTAAVEITAAVHNIALQPGWNLVSFNVHPTDTTVGAVLSSIAGNYNLVYAWDATGAHASSGNWLRADNIELSPDTLTNIDETMGFWIFMNTADTLEVVGSIPTETNVNLYANVGGWNLVGYPSMSDRAMPNALTDHGVGTDLSLVYGYRANDLADPWELYDMTVPPYFNDLTHVSSGWGYWVKVSANHVWNVRYLP